MMKRYFVFLSLALFSCDEDTVPFDKNDFLELSPYLIEKVGYLPVGATDTVWTSYSYSPEGYFLSTGEKINEANAGSESLPFAELNANVRLYVDNARRVIKEENNMYVGNYIYNAQDRLEQVIRTFKVGNLKDTVRYT